MRRFLLSLASVVAVALPACAADNPEAVRVACVGDSITAGSGYPKELQKLLGDGYAVRNFGVSTKTLLSKGDEPYIRTKAYIDALEFKPNVVVIKLGTNDTKPQNWKHADGFDADYKALVASFQAQEPKPKVFLCTPVPAYKGNFGITDEVVRTGVKPKVEALGKDLKLPVIDLYAALSDKAEMFPDQIHPNAAGAKLMADAVAAALRQK